MKLKNVKIKGFPEKKKDRQLNLKDSTSMTYNVGCEHGSNNMIDLIGNLSFNPAELLDEKKILKVIQNIKSEYHSKLITFEQIANAIVSSRDVVKQVELDLLSVIDTIQQTQVGTFQPIGEKGKPTPEPKPLFLGNYKVDYGIITMLAEAIVKAFKEGSIIKNDS